MFEKQINQVLPQAFLAGLFMLGGSDCLARRAPPVWRAVEDENGTGF
jgi:hypothetical protein